jgi:hypothetical protein
MRKILISLFFLIIGFSFSSKVFANTTLQANPILRLNNNLTNLQIATQERFKAIDATAAKGNTQKETPKPTSFPYIPWETIAVIISILSGLAAIMGFSVSSHKKKRAISKYMEEIDATFSEFKWKSKRCEAELYRLRDLLEERLKKGKIDESLYELLTKRIDKYLHEIQDLPEGS